MHGSVLKENKPEIKNTSMPIFRTMGAIKMTSTEGRTYFLQKREKDVINKNWLLLDSQSMVDQVANPALLKNFRKVARAGTMHCNADLSAPTWREI